MVWLDALDGLLQQRVHQADTIYLDSNENDRKGGPLITREYRYIREMKEKYPLHNYRRSAKVLRELRAVKTALEVSQMQEASDITGATFLDVLGMMRPGVMEYEIEAEVYRGFLSRRSSGPAYSSIIASGDRARTLHYISNNQECKDGELVLMDFGAEYGGYCADLTRTVPVSGKFTKRQKEGIQCLSGPSSFCKELVKAWDQPC
ncbi:M24 family metallopeptidase [Puia sp. P3]|uniref:M24 family metallopeptidase n=1 Tax=Puia sp. P3 TaxID=3423952 RepID=UPI003D664576